MGAIKKYRDGAVALYESGLSLAQIAEIYGVTRQSVWDWLRRRGVAMRPRLRFGEENHFYRGGGRVITERGYVKVYCKSGKWRFEHRVVMERVLGRALSKDEDVHHKNGVRSDNRPENLSVMSHASHSRHHHIGRSKGVGVWKRKDVTEESVKELIDSGMSHSAAAKKLGCDPSVVKARLR